MSISKKTNIYKSFSTTMNARLNFLVHHFILWTFFFVCFISFQNGIAQDNDSKFKVVLDAGHGGKDPGNTGNGFKEKKVVLSVVLLAGKKLEENNGVEVIYTRTKDEFISLDERAKIANKAEADLFVSVHCNAAANASAYGSETFVLGLHRNEDNLEVAKRENSVIYLEDDYEVTYGGFDPESPESYISFALMQEEYLDQSILAANHVQNYFTNSLSRKNRGVKQAGFLVLRETYMPSILVELGFLTNKTEGNYLNSSAGQKAMANEIVKSIFKYKDNINLASSVVERDENETTTARESYEFRVQLAAGSSKLEAVPENFKGLKPLTRGFDGEFYRYFFGSTYDYMDAQELLEIAQKKGFESAFIVAFNQDEKRVPVSQALKSKLK
ncbi:MAG: N-acetylmuramoyl-L-alanine amidase family protein [Bacteroidota bacterium]